MDALFGSIRCGPWPSAVSVVALVSLVFVNNAAFATEYTRKQSLHLRGSAALRADQSTQQSARFKLSASLTRNDATIAASPPVQEGGGFAVMAKLLVKPTVCYNDTIFRDDFDGDGG